LEAVVPDTFQRNLQVPKTKCWLSISLLVTAHIEANAGSLQEAEANIQAGHSKARDDILVPGISDPYQGDPIFTERAFLYAENVTKVVK
jgi:hypothetical protein